MAGLRSFGVMASMVEILRYRYSILDTPYIGVSEYLSMSWTGKNMKFEYLYDGKVSNKIRSMS